MSSSSSSSEDAGAVARLVCPWCSVDLLDLQERCLDCDGDLRPLVALVALADEYFNLAVRAARAGDWDGAAEHVAVTLAVSPQDIAALGLLGKIRYRQGRHGSARAAWLAATEFGGERADLRQALQLVDAAADRSSILDRLRRAWRQLSSSDVTR